MECETSPWVMLTVIIVPFVLTGIFIYWVETHISKDE